MSEMADLKELIASCIFDFDRSDKYTRPTEVDAHKIAEEIIENLEQDLTKYFDKCDECWEIYPREFLIGTGTDDHGKEYYACEACLVDFY